MYVMLCDCCENKIYETAMVIDEEHSYGTYCLECGEDKMRDLLIDKSVFSVRFESVEDDDIPPDIDEKIDDFIEGKCYGKFT